MIELKLVKNYDNRLIGFLKLISPLENLLHFFYVYGLLPLWFKHWAGTNNKVIKQFFFDEVLASN